MPPAQGTVPDWYPELSASVSTRVVGGQQRAITANQESAPTSPPGRTSRAGPRRSSTGCPPTCRNDSPTPAATHCGTSSTYAPSRTRGRTRQLCKAALHNCLGTTRSRSSSRTRTADRRRRHLAGHPPSPSKNATPNYPWPTPQPRHTSTTGRSAPTNSPGPSPPNSPESARNGATSLGTQTVTSISQPRPRSDRGADRHTGFCNRGIAITHVNLHLLILIAQEPRWLNGIPLVVHFQLKL